MKQIILNSKNFISSSGNQFIYNFPVEQRYTNKEIAVSKIQIYHCTYNISSSIGNNKYTIKWIDGSIYEHTVPDGFYSISNLNLELQNFMISQKLYTIPKSSSSSYTIYIYLTDNEVAYGTTITTSVISTDHSTYDLPTGATWTKPTTSIAPQIKLNSGLETLLGISMNQQYFPTTNNSTITTYSNGAPEILYTNCYNFLCNMVYSDISVRPELLHSCAIDVSFGSMIVDKVPSPTFFPILNNNYTQLIITVVNQHYENIKLLDPEFIMILLVK